jgi:hypothetical protein
MDNESDELIAKGMYRLLHADYLIKYVKDPLNETISAMSESEGFLPFEVDLTILTLIFIHIDLLGCLYKGKNSSNNAVEFIRDYLGRIDSRYKEIGGLLYEALRHGLVHLGTPKRILLSDGDILDFSYGHFTGRKEYLKVNKTIEFLHDGSRVNVYRLLISDKLFFEDLLSSIDLYADDIRSNQEMSDRFWAIFETRRKPQKAQEIDLRKKSYILNSDFDFVKRKISETST